MEGLKNGVVGRPRCLERELMVNKTLVTDELGIKKKKVWKFS